MSLVGDPHAYGTEIDIVEHRAVNNNQKNIADTGVANLHWDGYGPEHKTVGSGRVGTGLSTGWHLYAMEWKPEFQNFYYDGILVWAVTNSPAQVPVPPEAPVSHRSQYFILSCEVRDAGWAGNIPAGGYGIRTASTTKMNVEYVRSYSYISEPVMSVANLGAGKLKLSYYGVPGFDYVLEQSTNLLNWTDMATNTAPPAGLIGHTNSAWPSAAYYRVRCQ